MVCVYRAHCTPFRYMYMNIIHIHTSLVYALCLWCAYTEPTALHSEYIYMNMNIHTSLVICIMSMVCIYRALWCVYTEPTCACPCKCGAYAHSHINIHISTHITRHGINGNLPEYEYMHTLVYPHVRTCTSAVGSVYTHHRHNTYYKRCMYVHIVRSSKSHIHQLLCTRIHTRIYIYIYIYT